MFVAKDAKSINEQDWEAIEAQYAETSPYNYAVIDDFLAPDACSEVRAHLINNKGWAFMNVEGPQPVLVVRNFNLPLIHEIASALIGRLAGVLGGLSLVEHSAFMNRSNNGLSIHSDNGLATLNIYLTPDEFNLDPEAGGLWLYDVKRGENQALHEFNSQPWCTEYFERHTKGGAVRIGYAFNRAILFDARTLHAAERMRFAGGSVASHRLNLALRFDRPEQFRSRYDPYHLKGSAPVAGAGG
ncbi:MAG: hypothetical protein M3416_01530 [Acidobacteriota bacterium]|nr:hypothetical protein [Acidobacteriota bacterium]